MRLILLDQAKQDLADIACYIANKSGNRYVGHDFVKKILNKCRDLAIYPYQMGIPRNELKEDLRSFPFGNYVIFFQYSDKILSIVTVIHGGRDMPQYFENESTQN